MLQRSLRFIQYRRPDDLGARLKFKRSIMPVFKRVQHALQACNEDGQIVSSLQLHWFRGLHEDQYRRLRPPTVPPSVTFPPVHATAGKVVPSLFDIAYHICSIPPITAENDTRVNRVFRRRKRFKSADVSKKRKSQR